MSVATAGRKLTNQEVADRLGITHSAVSRLRSGKRVASLPTLLQMNKEFGVDLETLTRAAAAAQSGDIVQWTELLDSVLVSAA